jgi:hypothetical protein
VHKVAILIVFTVLMHSFSGLLVLAGFELNKSYIAANLCENRFSPGKKCCGLCKLKKELKKDDSGKQSPTSQVNGKTAQLFFQPIQQSASSEYCLKVETHFNYVALNHSKFTFSIFHPPQSAVSSQS